MFVLLLVVVLFTVWVRFRLLEVPLERDEGEYGYGGQLILRGEYPYDKLYSAKMPGVYAAYAVIMKVFGETQRAVHLGLLIINTATVFLMLLLGRKLLNQLTGVVAAAAFALLSLGTLIISASSHLTACHIRPVVSFPSVNDLLDYQKGYAPLQ